MEVKGQLITKSFVGEFQPRVFSSVSPTNLTIDSDSIDLATVLSQASNLTVEAPTGTPVQGQKIQIRITDDGTSRTITWNAVFRGSLPSQTKVGESLFVELSWNEEDSVWDTISSGASEFTGNASDIPYDNSTSSLAGADVQAALDEIEARVDSNDAKVTNQSTTLNYVASPTLGTITSDGTSAFIPLADATNAGLLTPGDKTKLDNLTDTDDQTAAEVPYDNLSSGLTASDVQGAIDEIETRVENNDGKVTNVDTQLSLGTVTNETVTVDSDGTSVTLPKATQTDAGVMSAADKTKLDGLTGGGGGVTDGDKGDIEVSNFGATWEIKNAVINTENLNTSPVTLEGTDKVIIQDTSDADNLKTVTAQSIADLAGTGIVNLSESNPTGTSVDVSSDTGGTSATLNSATNVRAGLMSATDKVKLDGITDTDDQTASEVSYLNGTSGLTATDVQAAIDEVDGNVDSLNGTNGITRSANDFKLGGTPIIEDINLIPDTHLTRNFYIGEDATRFSNVGIISELFYFQAGDFNADSDTGFFSLERKVPAVGQETVAFNTFAERYDALGDPTRYFQLDWGTADNVGIREQIWDADHVVNVAGDDRLWAPTLHLNDAFPQPNTNVLTSGPEARLMLTNDNYAAVNVGTFYMRGFHIKTDGIYVLDEFDSEGMKYGSASDYSNIDFANTTYDHHIPSVKNVKDHVDATKYAADILAGDITVDNPIVINHNLNDTDILIQLWDKTNGEAITAKYDARTLTSVNVTFVGSTPAGDVRIVIKK